MSAFTNGFNFGFATGFLNRMFSGFNPFCCFNFTPTFFTPTLNTSIFTPYSIPTANMSFQNFSMPATNNSFNWNSVNTNNTWSSFPMGDNFIKSSSSSRNYSDTDTSNFSYDAEALKNKWQKKNSNLSQEFFNKVVQVAKRVNCDPNDLMCLMNSESGLKTTAVNKSSGATGLIQFMPATAKGLGTSCSALKNMSPEEQMVYVEKCITDSKRMAGLGNQKIGAGTLYALIFLPSRAGRDIITTSGEKYYSSNKGLDIDGDGKISKADLAKRIKNCDA